VDEIRFSKLWSMVESLPAEEDIKKVKRRIASDQKKSLGFPEALED